MHVVCLHLADARTSTHVQVYFLSPGRCTGIHEHVVTTPPGRGAIIKYTRTYVFSLIWQMYQYYAHVVSPSPPHPTHPPRQMYKYIRISHHLANWQVHIYTYIFLVTIEFPHTNPPPQPPPPPNPQERVTNNRCKSQSHHKATGQSSKVSHFKFLFPSQSVSIERITPTNTSAVRFSSAQGGIYALGKAHMRSAPSLGSFPNVAFETVSPQQLTSKQ